MPILREIVVQLLPAPLASGADRVLGDAGPASSLDAEAEAERAVPRWLCSGVVLGSADGVVERLHQAGGRADKDRPRSAGCRRLAA